MNYKYFKFIYSCCCRVYGESKRYFKFSDNISLNDMINISELIFNMVANRDFDKLENFFRDYFETVSFSDINEEDRAKIKVVNIGESRPLPLFCQNGMWQKIVDEYCGTDFQNIADFNKMTHTQNNQIQYFRLNIKSNDNKKKKRAGLVFKNKDNIIKPGDPFFDLIFQRITNKDFDDTELFLKELGFVCIDDSFTDDNCLITDFYINEDNCGPFTEIQTKISAIEYIGTRLMLLTNNVGFDLFRFCIYNDDNSYRNSVVFRNNFGLYRLGLFRTDNLLLELIFRDVVNENFFLLKQFLAYNHHSVVSPEKLSGNANVKTLVIGNPNLKPLLARISHDEALAWINISFPNVSEYFIKGLLDKVPEPNSPITDELVNFFETDVQEVDNVSYFKLREYRAETHSFINGDYIFINKNKINFEDSPLIDLIFWYIADNNLANLEQILLELGLIAVNAEWYYNYRNSLSLLSPIPNLIPLTQIDCITVKKGDSFRISNYFSRDEAISYILNALKNNVAIKKRVIK